LSESGYWCHYASQSYVAGIGIRSSISVGYGSDGIFDWKDAWLGAMQGLFNGVASLAIDFAGQQIESNPLLANFTSRTLLGGIEGMFENPQNASMGFIKGALEGIINSTLNFVTMGLSQPIQDDTDMNWYNTVYLSRVINFSDLINRHGIEEAIETHAASIFQADAVATIFKNGGIRDFLSNKASPWIDSNGNTIAIIVDIDERTSLYLNPANDEVVGRKSGNITEYGKYGVDSLTGKFGLISGMIREQHDGYYTESYMENGRLISLNVFNESSNLPRFSLYDAIDPLTGLPLDEDNLLSGSLSVYDRHSGTVSTFTNGTLNNIKQYKNDQTQSVGAYLDARGFEERQRFLEIAGQKLGTGSYEYEILRKSINDFQGNHFNPWGSITTSRFTVTASNEAGTVTAEYSTSQTFRPEGAINYVGKSDSTFDLNGGLSLDISGLIPSMSGSYEATYRNTTGPLTSGYMLGITGNPSKISVSKSLVNDNAMTLKIGTHSSFNNVVSQNQHKVYYQKGTGDPIKTYYQYNITTLAGITSTVKYSVDPNAIREKMTIGISLTNNEKNALLLHEVATGERAYLTSSEKEDLTQFMYNVASQLASQHPDIDQTGLFESTRDYVSNITGLTQNAHINIPAMTSYISINASNLQTYEPIKYVFDPIKWGVDFSRYLIN